VNAQTQIARDYSRAQTNAECRRDAALRDIREKYARLLRRLTARQAMEESRVQRDFVSGKLGR
jgi:DNA-binding IscR family transcriptional regulator